MFQHARGRSSRAPTARRSVSWVLAILAVVAAPVPVAGHAQLETIAPADRSSGPAPTEIVGTFSQNLDAPKTSFAIVDAGGRVVAKGGDVTAGDPRTLTLTLTTALAPGPYTIRWTTGSTEDGELAHGETTFAVVVAPSPSSSAAPSASASRPAASVGPGVPATAAPSPTAPPADPVSSGSDAVVPIIAALVALLALGLWLARGRSRGTR